MLSEHLKAGDFSIENDAVHWKGQSFRRAIFCSGYSLEVADRDALLVETDNFLPKPYTPDKLANLVRTCLDGEVHTTRFA